MSLAFKEGIKISPSVVEELVLSSGQDIRQVIHNLSLWRGSGSSSPDDVPKAKVIRESKLVSCCCLFVCLFLLVYVFWP